ncbi:unnamed protein product [Lactuca virosa]|uniref:RRM domain-containing protein n=1 Tax=Lactuca virosa TaxID=75947 RepID=A0AAU9NV14_9ASTR|nr:unnamed protein product [Lactuca virosa]
MPTISPSISNKVGLSMDGEWTVARRSRWKLLSRKGDRLGWNHVGVTTMFVLNLPEAARKGNLKNIFAKYGEVVDVYMVTKRDVNKRSFAFV